MSVTNIIKQLFKAVISVFIVGASFYISILYFGPLLFIPIGMIFTAIFGDGAYLEYLMYLISYLCAVCFSTKLVSEIYDTELKAFRAKKQRQKDMELKKALQPVLAEMKQNTAADDKEGQKAIKKTTDFIYGTEQQRKEIASLQFSINKLKAETSPDNKQAQKNIKFLEKLLETKMKENNTMY